MRRDRGFTLLELVVAMALGSIVLLSSANLLINFANFSNNLVKGETALLETAVGTYEEILFNIVRANAVVIGGEAAFTTPNVPFPTGCGGSACIQVRVDTEAAVKTPSNYADDTVYTYYGVGTAPNIDVRRMIGTGPSYTTIAKGVQILSFSRPVAGTKHQIFFVIEGWVQSGTTGGYVKEHMETTVNLRARGA